MYKETKRIAQPYKEGDSLGQKFKSIPVLGYGIPNLEETIAICFAHNVKNGLQRIFALHGDVGSSKFTEELRALEPHDRFPRAGAVEWLVDQRAVRTFEVRLLHSVWGRTTKSPFQNKKGVSISKQRAEEIYTGLTSLRQDRRMVDYIRMLRSGVCELAIYQTVPDPFATVTVQLLRAISRCLRDSVRVSELDDMKVIAYVVVSLYVHITI